MKQLGYFLQIIQRDYVSELAQLIMALSVLLEIFRQWHVYKDVQSEHMVILYRQIDFVYKYVQKTLMPMI